MPKFDSLFKKTLFDSHKANSRQNIYTCLIYSFPGLRLYQRFIHWYIHSKEIFHSDASTTRGYSFWFLEDDLWEWIVGHCHVGSRDRKRTGRFSFKSRNLTQIFAQNLFSIHNKVRQFYCTLQCHPYKYVAQNLRFINVETQSSEKVSLISGISNFSCLLRFSTWGWESSLDLQWDLNFHCIFHTRDDFF